MKAHVGIDQLVPQFTAAQGDGAEVVAGAAVHMQCDGGLTFSGVHAQLIAGQLSLHIATTDQLLLQIFFQGGVLVMLQSLADGQLRSGHQLIEGRIIGGIAADADVGPLQDHRRPGIHIQRDACAAVLLVGLQG